MTVSFTDLPVHDLMPRWIAVGLAFAVIAAFLFWGFSPSQKSARASFEDERARLMRELVGIEERRRAGKAKAKDAERRPALMAELERVLAALDEAPGAPGAAA
jgi:type VI protein secretion system component VasK